MGKLHTLRRAIEREPDKWSANYYGGFYPHGARFHDGQWEPCRWLNSYRKFVTHVLKTLQSGRHVR